MNTGIKFIAEIGSNHNQDEVRLVNLLYKVAELGFWGVKFQLFDPEKLYAPERKEEIKTAHKRALPKCFVPAIRSLCDRLNLKFICTPFDFESAKYLASYIDYYKISSFDVLRTDLIEYCAKALFHYLFLSTGLATYSDLRKAVSTITSHKFTGLCLMHCVSRYPTPRKESCVGNVSDLVHGFCYDVDHIGYSDHTVDVGAVVSAIRCGANFVELHFDLDDKKGAETVHGHCWTPKRLKKLFNESKKLNVINSFSYFNLKKIIKIKKKYGIWNYPSLEELAQRADPSDGLRPMLSIRKNQLS